jgi:hypothetical protein
MVAISAGAFILILLAMMLVGWGYERAVRYYYARKWRRHERDRD